MNIDTKILNKILNQPNPMTHKKDHTPRPNGIHRKFPRKVQSHANQSTLHTTLTKEK